MYVPCMYVHVLYVACVGLYHLSHVFGYCTKQYIVGTFPPLEAALVWLRYYKDVQDLI